jgi:hypothetical protein
MEKKDLPSVEMWGTKAQFACGSSNQQNIFGPIRAWAETEGRNRSALAVVALTKSNNQLKWMFIYVTIYFDHC